MFDTPFDDRAIVVVDLGFGDAGKGATVDWLCSQRADLDVSAVVRFNGGAQAAHNVVVDGRHHTFSQFGSGMLSGVQTFLSKHMLVEPIALATESRQLADLGVVQPLSMLSIDERALVTTPIHVAANRTREDRRGRDRHGSCGKGIGETAWYALEFAELAPTVGDCRQPGLLRSKLEAMAEHYGPLLDGSRHRYPEIADLVGVYTEFACAVKIVGNGHLGDLAARGRLVLEGAQGVLLDEWRGFHPYTTWSTVEPSNARRVLAEIGCDPYVLGVTRSYLTRHGAGPFPTENARLGAVLTEPHNPSAGYQGAFRVGHFDPVLLRYAMTACGGVDGVAISHLDALETAAGAGVPIAAAAAYVTAAGIVESLPLGTWQDLEHQQALTDVIGNVSAVLEPLPIGGAADWIGDALETPVVLTADGPDRAARRQRVGAA
ncbi:adenylosuccinate synthetase [Antrihabitans sp. YC2-6]|uniref:adenylosuccinate synthetase n=1 Tax=Antrihabitans sp. YC2-6 TaxID=2799498 RepID=UPI0018F4EC29|nr:adenylosuccinate synthetase [Antrihabitans sp. YC2-6]MBJ8345093.1 adenylosuccinate synthetase [Antrihabitans sp. YC2-6]